MQSQMIQKIMKNNVGLGAKGHMQTRMCGVMSIFFLPGISFSVFIP